MALTLLRWRAAPPPTPETAEPPPNFSAEPPADLPPDDYLIEGEDLPEPVPNSARLVHTLQIVLILIIAALSFAIFCLMGLVLNLL